MSTEIEKSKEVVLRFLYEKDLESQGEAWVRGNEISEATELEPAQINDAIKLLRDLGLVEWLLHYGTTPYEFGFAKINPRGKYEMERRSTEEPSYAYRDMMSLLVWKPKPPAPVGSPYGFTKDDWDIVSKRKRNKGVLYVVLGCKFESANYDTQKLRENIKDSFENAVKTYNRKNSKETVSLEFIPLHAGYGEHVFNKIARDIISSDVSVFDISDLAPNVFIEIGVALTWGTTKVLIIKKKGCSSPPSDISGHTYAVYADDGKAFSDPQHEKTLYNMVERAIRNKG